MTQLSWPDTVYECARPRRRDFMAGGTTASWLQVRRGRHLFGKTQRLMKKREWAAAGNHVVGVSASALAGIEVSAERHGLRWRLALADVPQRAMFAVGGFEDELLAWVLREMRPNDVVADIGAHVGLLSVQFADRLRAMGGGKVLSFEPAPDSAAHLRDHLAMNDLASYVTVTEAAVGAETDVVQLRAVAPGDADDPSLRSLFGSGELVASVPLIRFDDWRNENALERLDVVKVDVEGAELGVVRGMRETLRELQPRLLVIEIKEHLSARAGIDTTEVVKELRGLGYLNRGPFSTVAGRRPMPHLDENFIFTRSEGE